MSRSRSAAELAAERPQICEAMVDTHAHLSDEAFAGDLDEILQQCAAAGIRAVIMPASDLDDADRIAAICRTSRSFPHPRLYAAAGVHPHEASKWDDSSEQRLHELLDLPFNCALGEVGLDYHYDFSPREVQQRVFREQIRVAHDCQKPLILHDREAHGDFLAILQEAGKQGLLLERPGVVHCYSGSPEFARELLKLGFYFGFDGPITFKNARQAPETIRELPPDHILVETDSPYLSPEPLRGRRNDPVNIPWILVKLAEFMGTNPERAARQTRENAIRLFGIETTA